MNLANYLRAIKTNSMTERNNIELKTFTAFRVRQSPMNMHLDFGSLTLSGCQAGKALRPFSFKVPRTVGTASRPGRPNFTQ